MAALSGVERALYNIINPANDIFPESKFIPTGRPNSNSCSMLQNILSHTKHTNVFILGFSTTVVKHYIDKFMVMTQSWR